MPPEITVIKRQFSFETYMAFVHELVESSSCSGEITADHIQSTKVNEQRMMRIWKQVIIDDKLSKLIRSVDQDWEWVVLTESWCADGAQNLPIVAKMAALSDKIKLKIILRDENPVLMEQYLTNGARAIPKLICKNIATGEVNGVWGPRPAEIQETIVALKAAGKFTSHYELLREVQFLYAKDSGQAIQRDFLKLVVEWGSSRQ
jgi:hypothetical protein